MGYYTEIFINVDLKLRDAPPDVLDTLKAMCNQGGSLGGKPTQWADMLCSSSCQHPRTWVASLTQDPGLGLWSLLGKGDLKNYNGEIQAFFDWIKPYVHGCKGDFIGYYKSEDYQSPTLVYLGRPDQGTQDPPQIP